MESPGVLCSLNDYLSIKSAVRLMCCSKMCKSYIRRKKYNLHTLFVYKNLYMSDLVKIKLFVDNVPHSHRFIDILPKLKIFKNVHKKFHHWNRIHWNLVVVYLCYRYRELEYEDFLEGNEPFMYNYYHYVPLNLIVEMFNVPFCIYKMYNIVKENEVNKYRELIMI